MKLILSLIFLSIGLPAFAQSVGAQDAEMMLNQMQASGKVTAEQAEITRRFMKTMDSKDWEAVQKKAQDCLKRNPAAAEKIKTQGIDAISPELCK